ncbi:MAG: ribose 5-phosphate isomerase B [bacterium]|nr:ribose 5-phosphate isomerase B [bacterium]
MKIAIGSDHRGYKLKEFLKSKLSISHEVKDFGTYSEEPCDYPDIAIPLAESVANGENNFGILICYTGIGMSISANKVKGIRAAHITDERLAILSRKHNDANIICLPGGFMGEDEALNAVVSFLEAEFEGGRHKRRIEKISIYEEKTK